MGLSLMSCRWAVRADRDVVLSEFPREDPGEHAVSCPVRLKLSMSGPGCRWCCRCPEVLVGTGEAVLAPSGRMPPWLRSISSPAGAL